MPNHDPILNYASPGIAPKRPLWRRAVLALMAAVTLIVCFFAWFAAIDARNFVQGWKRYGNDPLLLPQLEAIAEKNAHDAAIVFAISIAGWGVYFVLRRRRADAQSG